MEDGGTSRADPLEQPAFFIGHGANRSHPSDNMGKELEREGSEAVDPELLSKALQDFKEAGQTRERAPTGSPSRKRPRIYGDR